MLSMKWAALEAITDKKFNEFSDVWSYGICCWEILSYGAHPYKGTKSANILMKIRDEGYRLAQPEGCGDETYDLLICCWDSEPENRPQFDLIMEELDELINESRDWCAAPRDIGMAAQGGITIEDITADEDEYV